MFDEFTALKDGLMGIYTVCHVVVTMSLRNVSASTLLAVKSQKTISWVNAGHANLKNHIFGIV